jgi:hypothetical protein
MNLKVMTEITNIYKKYIVLLHSQVYIRTYIQLFILIFRLLKKKTLVKNFK